MGADLTIIGRDSRHGAFEVSDRAVKNGYFRDAYNSYGLFGVLTATIPHKTYSWWQFSTEGEGKGFFDKDGNLKPNGAKILLARMRDAKLYLENVPRLKREEMVWDDEAKKYKRDKAGNFVYETLELSPQDDKFTRHHLDLLIQFLDDAVKTNSSIEWSV